jgi:hypothetical protein
MVGDDDGDDDDDDGGYAEILNEVWSVCLYLRMHTNHALMLTDCYGQSILLL